MSEQAGTSPHRGRFRLKVRGPRDFYGGLALAVLAAVALWAAADLPGLQGFTFGPGTAPRLFAGLLVAVGVLVAVNGLLYDGPPIEAFAVRGPTFVVAAIVAFAVMIRGADLYLFHFPALGLIPSTFGAFTISMLGSREMRWVESLLAATGMTVFCMVLFVYLLQLPFQLWPEF